MHRGEEGRRGAQGRQQEAAREADLLSPVAEEGHALAERLEPSPVPGVCLEAKNKNKNSLAHGFLECFRSFVLTS